MQSGKRKPTHPQILPFFLMAFGLILFFGGMIWMILRQETPQKTAQATLTQAPPANPPDPNRPFPEIQRVSLEQARGALDGQQAVFLDVRDPQSYQSAHIPGAINIPLADLDTRASELDPNQWIITYCT